jgi:hypothetical protein
MEHHSGEELCEYRWVAVNEGVLTVLDLEQGFSDADLCDKLLLFLLGESEGEEMHSLIFLALNIYLVFELFQSKIHRNIKFTLYQNFYYSICAIFHGYLVKIQYYAREVNFYFSKKVTF